MNSNCNIESKNIEINQSSKIEKGIGFLSKTGILHSRFADRVIEFLKKYPESADKNGRLIALAFDQGLLKDDEASEKHFAFFTGDPQTTANRVGALIMLMEFDDGSIPREKIEAILNEHVAHCYELALTILEIQTVKTHMKDGQDSFVETALSLIRKHPEFAEEFRQGTIPCDLLSSSKSHFFLNLFDQYPAHFSAIMDVYRPLFHSNLLYERSTPAVTQLQKIKQANFHAAIALATQDSELFKKSITSYFISQEQFNQVIKESKIILNPELNPLKLSETARSDLDAKLEEGIQKLEDAHLLVDEKQGTQLQNLLIQHAHCADELGNAINIIEKFIINPESDAKQHQDQNKKREEYIAYLVQHGSNAKTLAYSLWIVHDYAKKKTIVLEDYVKRFVSSPQSEPHLMNGVGFLLDNNITESSHIDLLFKHPSQAFHLAKILFLMNLWKSPLLDNQNKERTLNVLDSHADYAETILKELESKISGINKDSDLMHFNDITSKIKETARNCNHMAIVFNHSMQSDSKPNIWRQLPNELASLIGGFFNPVNEKVAEEKFENRYQKSNVKNVYPK